MDAPPLIRWNAPGPYAVAFSTRRGGVSEGAYASLNLGLATAHDPEHVWENRRRVCNVAGADATRAAMAYQRHSGDVVRAEPQGLLARSQRPQCDGLWSDVAGQAMLLLGADCVLVAVARKGNGGAPALALLHAGWQGLLGGIVAAGTAVLGDGPLTAVIGPSIGPCCYQVRDDVAMPFRETFGDDVVCDGKLDLWTSVERALRDAGVDDVDCLDLCTFCHPDLFFSHRRDRGTTGRQGVIGYVRG